MIWTYIIFIVAFIPGLVFCTPIQQNFGDNFESRRLPPFTFYFAIQDSQYVKTAYKTLSSAFDEITFDLQLDQDDSFDVYIMPTRKSFRDALQGRLPDWTSAYANPGMSRMVVKSPRWNPDEFFETTLVHELFHLLIHFHLGTHTLPRWMDEGLAIFYSGEDRWKTATPLSKAITTRSLIPLADIDYVLQYHQAKADLAYQQSYSAVEYLLQTYDIDAVRQIFAGLKAGSSLDACFISATGSSYSAFEMEWQDFVRKTHRWMWFYELDQYVWIFIFGLLLLVYILRRIRNKRIEGEWRRELEADEQIGEVNHTIEKNNHEFHE